jgi:adenylate kinase family enzyme
VTGAVITRIFTRKDYAHESYYRSRSVEAALASPGEALRFLGVSDTATGHAVAKQRAAMRKVAVFGNAGGEKSTLSKKLSEITGLPLYVLDKIKYQSGGIEVSQEDYRRAHEKILVTDQWIIDGFGCMGTLLERLNEADTLVFVDLPLYVHFWLVTKRLVTGYFKLPEDWPEKNSMLKSSLNSYRVLWLCYKHLTNRREVPRSNRFD